MWAGSEPKHEWAAKVPMVYFFVPLPDKVKEERNQRKHLEVISKCVLPLNMVHVTKGADRPKRIRAAVELFGFVVDWEEPVINIDFDREDPIESAASKIGPLLVALRTAVEAPPVG
jgi:hypothetical protein